MTVAVPTIVVMKSTRNGIVNVVIEMVTTVGIAPLPTVARGLWIVPALHLTDVVRMKTSITAALWALIVVVNYHLIEKCLPQHRPRR